MRATWVTLSGFRGFRRDRTGDGHPQRLCFPSGSPATFRAALTVGYFLEGGLRHKSEVETLEGEEGRGYPRAAALCPVRQPGHAGPPHAQGVQVPIQSEMSRKVCRARTRSGDPCRNSPLKRKRPYKLHGGASTGPKPPDRPVGNRGADSHQYTGQGKDQMLTLQETSFAIGTG